MTDTPQDAPGQTGEVLRAGMGLDCRVAQALGWTHITPGKTFVIGLRPGREDTSDAHGYRDYSIVPAYSTDIGAAMGAMHDLLDGRLYSHRARFNKAIQRIISERIGMKEGLVCHSEVLRLVTALDICGAILKATEGKPDA